MSSTNELGPRKTSMPQDAVGNTSSEQTSHGDSHGADDNKANPYVEGSILRQTAVPIASCVISPSRSNDHVPRFASQPASSLDSDVSQQINTVVQGTDRVATAVTNQQEKESDLNSKPDGPKEISNPHHTPAPTPEHISIQAPGEWKSRWLRPYNFAPLVVVTLLFICAIIALCIASTLNQGITTLDLANEKKSFSIGGIELGISISWTFLPVLILQLFVLITSATVRAAAMRQPYIELRELGDRGGARAEESIFLDYQSYAAPLAPIKAIKHGHIMLAYSMCVTLLTNIVLTALAAHLFFTEVVQRELPIAIEQWFEFNDHYTLTYDNLESIFDRVLGTRVYGGKLLPWTTLNEAFLPFELDSVPITTNLSIRSDSYSASLDCKVLEPGYEFELVFTDVTGWALKVADRGCEIDSQYFTAPSLAKEYLETFTTQSCGLKSGLTRLIVVAAINTSGSLNGSTATTLTNKTVVSCIPSYLHQTGQLSISVDDTRIRDPQILKFIPKHTVLAHDPRPGFADSFEVNLSRLSGLTSARNVFTSELGYLIYSLALMRSSTSYFDGKIIQSATEDIFRSFFAAMANQVLVQQATSRSVNGLISRHETRLIVVLPIAYTFVCILVIVSVMLVWLWVYSSTHTSILYEEPSALLGIGAILRNSELMDRIEAVEASRCGGQVAGEFKRSVQRDKIPKRWVLKSWGRPDDARLCSVSDIG